MGSLPPNKKISNVNISLQQEKHPKRGYKKNEKTKPNKKHILVHLVIIDSVCNLSSIQSHNEIDFYFLFLWHVSKIDEKEIRYFASSSVEIHKNLSNLIISGLLTNFNLFNLGNIFPNIPRSI